MSELTKFICFKNYVNINVTLLFSGKNHFPHKNHNSLSHSLSPWAATTVLPVSAATIAPPPMFLLSKKAGGERIASALDTWSGQVATMSGLKLSFAESMSLNIKYDATIIAIFATH